jgi:hypothetical protein
MSFLPSVIYAECRKLAPYDYIMLSVIMLSVVMLNVVAPRTIEFLLGSFILQSIVLPNRVEGNLKEESTAVDILIPPLDS